MSEEMSLDMPATGLGRVVQEGDQRMRGPESGRTRLVTGTEWVSGYLTVNKEHS